MNDFVHVSILFIAHKSGLLRIFSIVAEAPPEIMKTFRSIHTGPIAFMKVGWVLSTVVPILRADSE